LNKENLIPHTEPKVRKLSNSILFKVAAAVLLIVGVTISGLYLFTKSGQNGMNYAQTEYNQKTVYLADGSVVKLNGNSKLVYPDVFNETSREVELVGEAFFDIAKNPEKPFIIKANNAEIKVLGTSFNVLAFKETELVEVFVKSGKVSVTPLENGNKSIVLQKGDFGKVQNKKASKDVLSDPNYMSWHSRKLYFVETPIKEVVEILNRSYACNIAINDTSINNYNFNSTYDNASLNTILESICTSYNIEKIEDNHRIILQNRHK